MENIFGLCLQEQGGTMYLGSAADEVIGLVSHLGATQWTPRVVNGSAGAGLYVVDTLDITVNGLFRF